MSLWSASATVNSRLVIHPLGFLQAANSPCNWWERAEAPKITAISPHNGSIYNDKVDAMVKSDISEYVGILYCSI
jgi:hypothetical protein